MRSTHRASTLGRYYAETRLHAYIISIHRGSSKTLVARYTCRRTAGVGIVAVSLAAVSGSSAGQPIHGALIKCIDAIEGADGPVFVLLPLRTHRADARH